MYFATWNASRAETTPAVPRAPRRRWEEDTPSLSNGGICCRSWDAMRFCAPSGHAARAREANDRAGYSPRIPNSGSARAGVPLDSSELADVLLRRWPLGQLSGPVGVAHFMGAQVAADPQPGGPACRWRRHLDIVLPAQGSSEVVRKHPHTRRLRITNEPGALVDVLDRRRVVNLLSRNRRGSASRWSGPGGWMPPIGALTPAAFFERGGHR